MRLDDPAFMARFREHERWIKENIMADPIIDEAMPEPITAAQIRDRIIEVDKLLPITEDALAHWVTKKTLEERIRTLRAERDALVDDLIAATPDTVTRGQA